jgi:trehalose 6-phosphate synthase/phosphatase
MRLVIASNRLPFTVSFEDGMPRFSASSGGLTTGLWSYLQRTRADPARATEFLWVGWPGISVAPEQQDAVRRFGEIH